MLWDRRFKWEILLSMFKHARFFPVLKWQHLYAADDTVLPCTINAWNKDVFFLLWVFYSMTWAQWMWRLMLDFLQICPLIGPISCLSLLDSCFALESMSFLPSYADTSKICVVCLPEILSPDLYPPLWHWMLPVRSSGSHHFVSLILNWSSYVF